MNALRTLASRLSLSSIRSRILVIALLPALLTEFGMVAYFTTQSLAAAEAALQTRARNAAHHLADALPYALVSGDTVRLYELLGTEMEASQLSYTRIIDPRGQLIASTGDTLHASLPQTHFEQRAEIRLPYVLPDGTPSTAPGGAVGVLLGHADVGVSLDQVRAFKRDTLLHAVLLMLVAL
ncbi:MAG: hybrid sensor histidine kinase/response regulator, partial [Thiobacillus sp.]|nr:hybrid sensor histidine kinase/response regulator [Thiobacillus sp.]